MDIITDPLLPLRVTPNCRISADLTPSGLDIGTYRSHRFFTTRLLLFSHKQNRLTAPESLQDYFRKIFCPDLGIS